MRFLSKAHNFCNSHFETLLLHAKLLTVVRVRGRDWISLLYCKVCCTVLCAAVLTSANEVFGDPSTPRTLVNSGSQSELAEAAPYIDKVEVKNSPENIEVFVEGLRPTSCHKSQEILVEQGIENTKIIIRMRRTEPPTGQLCQKLQDPLQLKVADLPKNQKSSYKILVLGHKGWHELDVSHLIQEGL